MLEIEALSVEDRTRLRTFLQPLADTALLLGYRMRERVALSPGMEDANALQGMASGEFGQAYQLFDLLGQLGTDVAALERRSEGGEYASMETLDRAPATWAEFLAVITVTGFATEVRLTTLASGCWDDLAGLARKALQEQQFHFAYCRDAASVMMRSSPPAAGVFAGALAGTVPAAARWLGPDTPARGRLADLQIVPGRPDRERDLLRERVAGATSSWHLPLADVGHPSMDWPADSTADSAVWSGWDGARCRARPGGPDAATVAALRIKGIDAAVHV